MITREDIIERLKLCVAGTDSRGNLVLGERHIVAAIVALSSLPGSEDWKPIETAPKRTNADDPMNAVLIAWTNRDGAPVVGEAYWHPEDPVDGGWWWAGTSPGDYYADSVESGITGSITHWRPLPSPPPTDGEVK